jgi:hypothetical protein
MPDATEAYRTAIVATLNANPGQRAELEKVYGEVWDTAEVQEKFEVQDFLAPFVSVVEKATGRVGTLMFQHMPRFYFEFTPIG